jgi:hypothetical protein
MVANEAAEVWIRRYSHSPECEILVSVRGKEICLRCSDYDHALKWARIECKSYGIASVSVEWIDEITKDRVGSTIDEPMAVQSNGTGGSTSSKIRSQSPDS